MAKSDSHAAGQTYEVHEVLEGEPPLDLGRRFETTDFGSAVDFAFDFLERRDPRREGAVSALEIVRVADSGRETVWRYSHTEASSGPRDVVRLWGYDVTRHWSRPYGAPIRPTPAHH